MIFGVALIVLVSGVFAKNDCGKELQSIIYGPETFAKQYLIKINAQLRTQTHSLFNPTLQASIISSFEQEYGVQVTLRSPFALGVQGTQTVCKNVTVEIPGEISNINLD